MRPDVIDFAVFGAHGSVFHVLNGGRSLCGIEGDALAVEEGIDARAVRVKGKPVCANCRGLLDRASTDEFVDPSRRSMVGRNGPADRTKGDQVPTRTSRRRAKATAAPGKKRSASASPATAKPRAAKPEGEKGTAILETLNRALDQAVGSFDRAPNKSGTYTRLRIDGKAFAYLFPPRPNSVAVKIPKQLLGVASKLPSGHGFKKTDWGLTRTISKASEVPAVAKALAVAADAVRPATDEPTAREAAATK